MLHHNMGMDGVMTLSLSGSLVGQSALYRNYRRYLAIDPPLLSSAQVESLVWGGICRVAGTSS